MEEFVEYAIIIMGTLGHKIFESSTETPVDIQPVKDTTTSLDTDKTSSKIPSARNYNVITAEWREHGCYLYKINGKITPFSGIESEARNALDETGEYSQGTILLIDSQFDNKKANNVNAYIAQNPDCVVNLVTDNVPFINDRVSETIKKYKDGTAIKPIKKPKIRRKS